MKLNLSKNAKTGLWIAGGIALVIGGVMLYKKFGKDVDPKKADLVGNDVDKFLTT
jgi:putative Mn2+ efflux pump MntP